MRRGQPLSPHQQGIVRRYYEHLDTIVLQRLAELVSDLALAEPARSASLWRRVALALEKTPVDPARARRVLDTRDVTALAALVRDLSATPSRRGSPH